MTELVIRPARRVDVPAIGATQAAAWRAAYGEIFQPDDLARLAEERRTTRWPAIFDSDGFADTTLLVAGRPGVVAFVHFGPSRTAPSEGGEIYSFNVNPDEWGRGAAPALMAQACGDLEAQGYRRVHLWTLEAAARARRFYEKQGFRLTGRTKLEGPKGGPPTPEVEYARPLS